MAVEIPVVIDIDEAFKNAAARVSVAGKPLMTSIDGLNKQLSVATQKAFKYQVDSTQWKGAVKQIQAITQALGVAQDKMAIWGSNVGSIRQMSAELASLSRRWEEMGAKQKFTASGELTADARQLLSSYKGIANEVQRTGKSLAQIETEERRILELAQKKRQTYKDEQRILASTTKTMNILQQQERILSSRLQATPVGTAKFKQLAAQLTVVRKELASASALAKRGGAAYRDFGNSAARSATQVGATTAALSTQSSVLRRLTGYLSGYTLLFAGVRFVHNIRQTTAELEMQRVALAGILNDTEKANELFRQIKAAALKSPFEIKDLVTYTKQLSAYQIETSKLFETTMKLADVSAGLGVDMNRLILAYGQVRAASVLRGQELRQFTEAGIPLVEKLAEKFRELGREGTTTADVFDLISKRAVPFSMIEDIFNDMTSAGGIFYNMQEKQSETLKGQWMKLRDAITIMYDEIGNTKTMHNAMTALINTANNMARSWRDVANWAKSLIAAIVTYNMVAKASVAASNAITAAEARRLALTKAHTLAMPKFIAAIIGETNAKKLSRIATRRLAVAQYKLAMATTVAEKALMRLWIAIIKNPYAAAAAAAIGLVTGIVAIVKNTREATITIDELEQSVSKFESSLRKQRDVNRLTTLYEELSKKSELTAEETEQLRRVTNELGKAFPSAVTGINAETDALEINIDTVRELSKAEQELELARLERDEKRARNRKDELEEEKQRIIATQQAGGEYRTIAIGNTIRSQWHSLTQEDMADMGTRLQEIKAELSPIEKTLERIQNLKIGLGLEAPEDDPNLNKAFTGWKKVLADLQEEKVKVGAPTIFTTGDIENMKTIQDLWKATKKGITETTTELNGLRNIQKGLTGDAARSNENAIKLTEKELELYNAIKAAFGFVFNRSGNGSSYTQDPFINQMQERIKFMKDFKKGYDDLNKYLSSSDALSKTADKLRTRGLSLGIEAAEQQKAAKELSKWYGDTIDTVYAEVQKKYKITGPVESFLSQQIKDTTNRGKALRDFQKLLQSLFDEKTDLDVSELEKSLENELKKVQDEVKRSETARDFYNNILDLTGDEDLAASVSVSVYGGIGQEFRERMQTQLNKALESVDASALSDELRDAFSNQDFKVILDNLDKFPEKWQETLKQMAADSEKFNANRAQQLLKDLQKAKTYSEKRIELAERTARRQEEIEAMAISDAAKKTLSDRNAKKEAEDLASLQYEAFKNTPMYVEMFADLDAASADMLSHMRGQLEQMKSNWKDLHPRELKELQSRLNELDSQLASRNPFKTLYTSVKNYIEMVREMPRRTAEEESISTDTQLASEKKRLDELTKQYEMARDTFGEEHQLTKMLKRQMQSQAKLVDSTEKQAEDAQNTAISYRQAAKAILDAAEGMKKWNGYLTESLDAVGEIVHVFSSDDFSDTFDTISDGIGKTAGGLVSTAAGIGKIMAGDVSGIVDVLKGISDVATGIFGTAQELNLKRIEKELKRQDDLLEDLSYSYDRLGEAMERAFGSDYIHNYSKQLENLNAQLEAYNKQADLEREKGKKADADKIKEYENNARDAQKAIEDMNGQLAEFFSGTDLTSAAQDFANAWIEAYKEFGSTTDAMKEKFQDMIQEMITNSLAARIMQEQLAPIFKMIDDLSQDDGLLSATDISTIAAAANKTIPMINDAMTTLMSQLTAAGYNMRQQPGGFTGISRSIAGASEESINGLAAGINTQNFYMSLISQNVAAILAAMTGEQVEGATATAAVPDTYKEQMLEYAGSLPQMQNDISSIRAMLSQVIKQKGIQTSYYVATNL